MTGGLPSFVWVTLATRTSDAGLTYHREARCHARSRTLRVPTIEAAALRVGLTLCVDCAVPVPERALRGRVRSRIAATEALAEYAATFARSA